MHVLSLFSSVQFEQFLDKMYTEHNFVLYVLAGVAN